MHGLFITGTDTGVGKTLVAAALVRLLRQQGRRVGACKPVATGAGLVRGQLVSEDSLRLAEAAGVAVEDVTRWTFAEPAAPPVAARQAGTTLHLKDLIAHTRGAARDVDILIVEGVGGLLCPLTEGETVADLATALGIPLVVVARRSLGTLNHTLLTVEVACQRGLAVAGVVISETTPPASLAEESNVEELRRRLPVPILAVVPHRVSAADRVEDSLRDVDWYTLSEASRGPSEIV
jgi:dethiobiotin synthetase